MQKKLDESNRHDRLGRKSHIAGASCHGGHERRDNAMIEDRIVQLVNLSTGESVARLTRLSQLTHRFSEFSWFDGCKVLIFLHAHPEKGL